MSASGGGKAIIAAFLANMGIAVAKFVAYLLSGSASMLAEAIHSVADSGNQLLLMLGGRKARRQAPTSSIPSATVASATCTRSSSRSSCSRSAGCSRSTRASRSSPTRTSSTNVWVPLTVLVIAIGLESFSLRTAIKESNHVRAEGPVVGVVRAPRQGARAAGRAARGRRGADRSGLRPASASA